MSELKGRKARVIRGVAEVKNLLVNDAVVILDEKWEGEGSSRKRRLLVRSLYRSGVEGWIDEADAAISNERMW